MKRALLKERAEHSETMKVTCLIALFPFLLGAYFGGCEGDGAIFSAILCAFSLVPLHIMDGEFTITPEYLRFTETLPLSVRQKVYSKQLYRLFYRLAFFVVGVLGHLGGLLGNETFDGGRMLAVIVTSLFRNATDELTIFIKWKTRCIREIIIDAFAHIRVIKRKTKSLKGKTFFLFYLDHKNYHLQLID
mgnify:CR=1 FL=1